MRQRSDQMGGLKDHAGSRQAKAGLADNSIFVIIFLDWLKSARDSVCIRASRRLGQGLYINDQSRRRRAWGDDAASNCHACPY